MPPPMQHQTESRADSGAETLAVQRGSRPTAAVAGAIDLERFVHAADERAALRHAGRRALGLEDGTPVIGVVARVQARRRFDRVC